MKVSIYATPSESIAPADAYAVIDVLRATSVMASALANGASSIIPVREIEDALALKAQDPCLLLGGERGGLRIEGFDLANSPLEYTKDKVSGRSIAMTTTNGTRALAGLTGRVYAAAYINALRTCEALSAYERVGIVCAGTKGRYSADDIFCAGALATLLRATPENDLARASMALYAACPDAHEALKQCEHYTYLSTIGMWKDLQYCFSCMDTDVLCIYAGGRVTKAKE